METPTEHIESLFANAGEYLENKTELWKLKIIDKSTDAISSIAEKVILVFVGLMFFLLLNIALALLIGYWLGYSFYGFFVMAAFYAIVGLVIHLSRVKLITNPISNSIIEKFLNKP